MLLKHNIMLKVEAVMFLHDLQDIGAVMAKLRKTFLYLNTAMIAEAVRLLTSSHHITACA